MREEYDIKNLNPRKNPYVKAVKRPITINLDENVVSYFKKESEIAAGHIKAKHYRSAEEFTGQ